MQQQEGERETPKETSRETSRGCERRYERKCGGRKGIGMHIHKRLQCHILVAGAIHSAGYGRWTDHSGTHRGNNRLHEMYVLNCRSFVVIMQSIWHEAALECT